jgi:large subunit ribosomal protein L4
MTTKKIKESKKPKIETTVPVYNFHDAKELKKLDLPEKIFDGKVNTALLHQVSVMYQANKRAGTASTKTRGEVSGGGKKPWRQKGTGRARVGSSRNPLWKGGGTVFGPHPRDYSYTLPRKIKRLAVKSALNGKLRDCELFLVDEVKLPAPKTKVFVSALKKFLKTAARVDFKKSKDITTLLIMAEPDENFKMASRNVDYVLLTDSNNFTARDLLLYKNLIVSEPALKKICKRISL